ncbi:LGFP repeat-containing protein, partial [Modestobacter lacusdianchii]
CGLVGGGCFQEFAGGSLYWTAATGAHFTRGSIRALWGAVGWENGLLGYPVSDEICGIRNGGCYTHFQGGSIYWTPTGGAHFVLNSMRSTWAAYGWENGTLGYPVGNPSCGLVNAGCFQEFAGGSLYWTAATGAHFTRGSIRALWGAVGWENGLLGYPTGDEICGIRNGGCYTHFQGGSIYWTPTGGAHFVLATMRDKWAATGWENGTLGYPVGNPSCGLVNAGCFQEFAGGSLYWTAATGSHFTRGSIRALWGLTGWENGYLGYPTTDENCGLRAGGCFTHFQHGSIYWSPATGAHLVTDAIKDAWAATGWENGPWGYPADEPRQTPGRVTQEFTGATVTYDTATGTITTR